jgi:hypothetical protein
MASYTTASNGQVILTSGAPLVIPAAQNIQGGLIEAAGAKSIASQNAAATHYQNMGAGQKGSGKKKSRKRKSKSKKTRRMRGGAESLNMVPLGLPTAGSVPGIDADNVHLQAVDLKNQVSADKLYDHLRGATPIKLGGFRLRGADELYPGSGAEEDTKGRRKVNGRRGKRTHRRKRGKSTHRRSRKRRHI